MKTYECRICGWIYDEVKGCPEEGIAAGTRWEDVPDDWCCPACGASKDEFDMVAIASTPDIAPAPEDGGGAKVNANRELHAAAALVGASIRDVAPNILDQIRHDVALSAAPVFIQHNAAVSAVIATD